MSGLTYMQQISDTNGNGLHIEPGIWTVVPATSSPQLPPSVVRMASIPYGTTLLAQGTAAGVQTDPFIIGTASLQPLSLDNGPPVQPGGPIDFAEMHLDQTTSFRTAPLPSAIDQGVIDDPNSILRAQIAGQVFSSVTALEISPTSQPLPGGGTDNTAFLAGLAANAEAGNAAANEVFATFWIESVEAQGNTPAFMQLQYSQTVMLDFNNIRWPHVTVGTLRQISAGPDPAAPPPPPVHIG